MHAHALAQSIAQRDGPPMFLEKIAKSFVGKVLQALAGIEGELVQRVPGLGIKLDAAADGLMIHGTAKSS